MTTSRHEPEQEVEHLPPVQDGATEVADTVEPESGTDLHAGGVCGVPAVFDHGGDFDQTASRRPTRIQRQRTAGWRAPVGSIYVGRPTAWGNPFPVAHGPEGLFPRADSVRMYRELVTTGRTDYEGHRFARSGHRGPLHVPTLAVIRQHLAGHDLACWCPLDVECHADVLIQLANS